MLDWLVVWGVNSTVGFVFKPILEALAKELKDLAKDAAKDWVKDLFKDCLKDRFEKVVQLMSKDPLDIAAGKALKEFLQLVQQELEDADLDEQELQQYIKPLEQFIKNKSVKKTLGSAFQEDCKVIDTKTLAQTWNNLNLLSLPDDFNWEKVAKRYLRKVKAIIRESDDLRKILDSQAWEEIAKNTKEMAGIAPDFDLLTYQETILEKYGNLKLESIDSSGYI